MAGPSLSFDRVGPVLAKGVERPAAGTARRGDAKSQAELRKAAAGLEEVLIKQTLETMAKAQLENAGFFGQGSAAGTEETQFEMLLSRALAEKTPLGLADQLADQLAGRQGLDAARQAASGNLAVLAAAQGAAGGNAKDFTPDPQVRRAASDEHGGVSRTGRRTGPQR